MDDCEFKTLKGIKIYTGNSAPERIKCEKNATYYRHKSRKDLMSPLKLQELTITGWFTNVQFSEKDLIKHMKEPQSSKIIMINCNFGEITHSKPVVVFSEDVLRSKKYLERKAAADRAAVKKPEKRTSFNPYDALKKPQAAEVKKPAYKERKKQGDGLHFNNQITFRMANLGDKTPYTIKLFCNGRFQIPHLKNPDVKIIVEMLIILRDYLRLTLKSASDVAPETVNIDYILPNSLKFSCELLVLSKHVFQNLNSIAALSLKFKKDEERNQEASTYLGSLFVKWRPDVVKSYVNTEYNMGVDVVQHNYECKNNVCISFNRPRPWHEEVKNAVITINRSGKITLSGCNSHEEAKELYWWLIAFYSENPEVIVDDDSDDQRYVENDSYDDGGAESVYSDS